jgi:ElaB/YqjD/DUF883 family membrane-anchored ribosome-binding protein
VGRGRASRTRDAEHVAGAAWDDLLDTLNQAGDTARSMRRRTRNMAGEATWRVGSATNEARRRASAARDALAGKRTPMPWLLIGASVACGAVFGMMSGIAAARRALAREADELDLEETAATDVAAPVTLVESTVPIRRES